MAVVKTKTSVRWIVKHMVDIVLQYGPKLVYSGILLFLSGIFLVEMLRVWTDTRLYIAPFGYERDGKVQQEAGANFARRVSQALRRVYFIYTGGGAAGGSIASTDQIGRGLSIDLPDVRTPSLQSVEVQAYGINFGSLLRSIRGWVHEPNEIVGFVSHYGTGIDVQASIQGQIAKKVHPSLGTGLNLGWIIREDDLGKATFGLACGIFRMLAASQSDLFRTIRDGDFCQFLKALEMYQEYRSALPRNIPKADKEKLLDQAQQLVQPLEGTHFLFVNKLAGLIYREKEEFEKADRALQGYLDKLNELRQSDQQIATFLDDIRARPAEGAARPSGIADSDFDGRSRVRPLRIGSSISSTEATGGSLCCFVKDREGKRYALTADFNVPGPRGIPVVQPGMFDGGKAPQDVIGTVASVITGADSDGAAAGALIELVANGGQSFDAAIPGSGNIKLARVADGVTLGEHVSLVGRTSGISKGMVEAVDQSIRLATGTGSAIAFHGLIKTSKMSRAGDGGAPVLNSKNELIGLVYAGGEEGTFVMPIVPILKALGVELALD